jgi:hypothetical protein
MVAKGMSRKATEADLWHILSHAAERYGVKERSELAALTLALRAILDVAPSRLDPPSKRKRSYSGKWSWEACNQLVLEVEAERSKLENSERSSSLRTVCRLLVKRDPWARLCANSKRTEKSEILREKYQRITAGWKEIDAAYKAKDWNKLFEVWEQKAQRGEWAGVNVWQDDNDNVIFEPFKAGYKSPLIARPEPKR